MSASSTPASGTAAKVSAMTTLSPPSASSLGKPKMSYRSAALTSMSEKIELTALGSLWSAIELSPPLRGWTAFSRFQRPGAGDRNCFGNQSGDANLVKYFERDTEAVKRLGSGP